MPNSNALQQELSDQLAHMATQLKRNAIHFSDSLANISKTAHFGYGHILPLSCRENQENK
jgi:hypothetical protein